MSACWLNCELRHWLAAPWRQKKGRVKDIVPTLYYDCRESNCHHVQDLYICHSAGVQKKVTLSKLQLYLNFGMLLQGLKITFSVVVVVVVVFCFCCLFACLFGWLVGWLADSSCCCPRRRRRHRRRFVLVGFCFANLPRLYTLENVRMRTYGRRHERELTTPLERSWQSIYSHAAAPPCTSRP